MAKHKNEHREICQIYLQYTYSLEIRQRRSAPEHRNMLTSKNFMFSLIQRVQQTLPDKAHEHKASGRPP